MSLAEVRIRARQGLHDHMAVPAARHDRDGVFVEDVTVRVHQNQKNVGDLAGTNLSYAENIEEVTRLVFLVAEYPDPIRNELFVLSANEGYFITVDHPPDGLTVKADVTRATAAELVGKTLPGS